MSWHVSATIEGGSPKDELSALRAEALTQNPECADQFESAKDVAYMIVGAGAVGGSEKKFVVTLSGHSNPGHEPRAGWATDMITVSVQQAMF
jgi:hypothetical protein